MSGCSPAGRRDWTAPRERWSRFGGRALAVPTDVADHEQVEAAAAAVEERFGEIDIWVNDAMSTVFARFLDTEPEEFRRATEVTYLGTVYGTMVALKRMTRPRPRQDRAGRLGALLPRDPAAGRLLRREVRDPRLHRLDPHRAAPRQEQGADHDGPAAGREHDAVQLVSLEAARPPEAGPADLPAGDPGGGRLLGRAPSPPRAVGRLQRRRGDPRPASSRRACSSTGISRGPASPASRSKDMPVQGERAGNLFEPVRRRCRDARHLRRPGQDPQPAAVGRDPSTAARRRAHGSRRRRRRRARSRWQG